MQLFSLRHASRASLLLGGLALGASALASSDDVSFARQGDVGIELGEQLSLGLSLNNPENLAVAYQLLSGPSDLVLDSATGEIQWTPSALSTETIRVQASVIGDASNTAVTSFSVLVVDEQEADAGLVAHWPLDGAAADVLGGLNSINYGAAPATGQVASSLNFDGNDFVELVNADDLPAASRTLSIWAKHGDDFDGNETLLAYGSGNTAMRITMEPNPYGYGKPAIRVGSTQRLVAANLLDADRWYHIVVTYDGTEGALYVDGQALRRGTVDWPVDPQQGYIGRWGADYWRGELDDARIYDRALSAGEVAELYHAGLSAEAVTPEEAEIVPVHLPAPLAYYSFDQGTTDDESGNGFDGTNLGAQPLTEGRFGAAMSFADEAYIELAQGDQFPAGRAPRTMMVWTRLSQLRSFGNFAISYGQSNRYGAGRYNQISSAFAAAYVGSSSASRIVRYRTYADGEWVHLAMTYDGEVGRLFIDGREIEAVTADWSVTPGSAAIGRLINTSQYWQGDLDEVRVYNQALDPEQIDRLFRNDTVNVDETPIQVPSVPEVPETPELPGPLVIGFDDLVGSIFGVDDVAPGTVVNSEIADGYQGLIWTHFNFTNQGGKVAELANTGFETGVVSGDIVAFDAAPSLSPTIDALPGETFDLKGGYFTAAHRSGLFFSVIGYLEGEPQNQVFMTLSNAGPGPVGGSTSQFSVAADGFIDFGDTFTGVDSIQFLAIGGRTASNVVGDSDSFIVDDLVIVKP